MQKPRYPLVLILLVGAVLIPALEGWSSERIPADPSDAEIVFGDIPRFWQAWDRYQLGVDLPVALQEDYISPGSPGVEAFARMKFRDASRLAEVIEDNQDYYASIRENSVAVTQAEGQIRKGYERLEALYPETVFPPVYFVIGALNSGGTPDRDKLIIGTEMYSRGPGTPTAGLNHWLQAVLTDAHQVPAIVLHEMVHFQQAATREVIWEVDWDNPRPLLDISIVEGAADFVAELVVGRHINPAAWEYGDSREQELWREFQLAMRDNDYSRWLYNSSRIKDRPADLAYFMGYKIVEAYYERQPDKRQAIRDIIEVRDFESFLEQSGYGAEVTAEAP